jgi:hypothetical protein
VVLIWGKLCGEMNKFSLAKNLRQKIEWASSKAYRGNTFTEARAIFVVASVGSTTPLHVRVTRHGIPLYLSLTLSMCGRYLSYIITKSFILYQLLLLDNRYRYWLVAIIFYKYTRNGVTVNDLVSCSYRLSRS